MPKQKTIYELTLPDGRGVAFRELTTAELRHAFEAGRGGNDEARSFETKLWSLRTAIVKIDGQAVSYKDLAGEQWDEYFSVRETMLLVRAWSQVHEPSVDEADRVGKSIRVTATGT